MLGCPIRKFADQFVCANPRNLSQLITSFIASESLGIPHTPLLCLLYFFALLMSYIQCSISLDILKLLLFSYFFFQYVNELSRPLNVESQALRIAL